MQVMQVLHMNGGDGETSYAKNCSVQDKIISIAKPAIEEAVLGILDDNIPESFGIADMGCSSGPNSFRVFSDIMNIIYAKCSNLGRLSPEFRVPPALNSSASMALNKGNIYISKSSPQSVLDAYSMQYQNDFSLFLKSRGEEILSGGRMVLSFMGRRTSDPTTEESCYHWELLAHALMSMVSEGLIEEEKVDSFNAPYYAPCPEELKLEVEKEGSFIIDRLEAFEIDWDGGVDEAVNNTLGALPRGQRVAKTIRAVVESMVAHHFGNHILDELFRRYAQMVGDYLSKTQTKYINLVISIIRKG
ncbi:hypothetical protein Patl1_09188 [Pistacia atlantica]|uniref:Uncharacterized protein n=1 Tax=Pistacia atlantica TaxID=434234 RepID=A0ACC1AKY7_9ROSI|nr:hypothetical protein Patl1_09188 [Pistacia atlantica]